MARWWSEWARQRQWQWRWHCFSSLILVGLVAFLGLLHTEQPFLPPWRIWSQFNNSMFGGERSQKSPPLPPPRAALRYGREKTRVAVCLVGGARKFELTGPSLLKHVVNRYKGFDVFLHAPLDKDSHKFSLLKEARNLAAIRIFIPTRINETTLQADVLTSSGSPNGIQGLLQYFNLVEGCLTMIKAYQAKHNIRYDWIVRTRVDGYWSGPLPPHESYSNKSYTLPPGSPYGGLNDRLGIGNMETSEVALSRLSLIPFLHSSGYRYLNSETAFKHQLDVKGVEYELKTFPFCILSERKYPWPPSRSGVPVASLSSKGYLNGAKCRPCTPASKGIEAVNIVSHLSRTWSWIVATPGLELCDAHDNWEKDWEKIFYKVAGSNSSALIQKIQNRALDDCIKDLEAMKRKAVEWDAPSSTTICQKTFQQPS